MTLCFAWLLCQGSRKEHFGGTFVKEKQTQNFCLQLMGEEPDLDPDITKEFFENNILQFDPSLLTENGMK